MAVRFCIFHSEENMKKILCLFLAFCLLFSGCAKEEQSRDSVSLWYIQGQEPEGLEELVNEYNKSLPSGLLPVSLRSFAHEQALAAAFDMKAPDLLMCYHTKAGQLYEQSLLRGCKPRRPEYGGALVESLDYIGRSFFPLGTQVQLLAGSSDTFDEAVFSDLEGFCRAAVDYTKENSKAAFTADDFSALFCHALLSLDTQFHAELSADKNKDVFKYVYNLLIETVLEGAMLSTEYSSFDVLMASKLPYAFVNSRDLAKMQHELQVYPEPAFKSSLKYPGLCLGLAVTAGEGRSLASIESFLDYVNQAEVNSSLALASGLVPAVPDMRQSDSSLKNRLMEIGAYYELFLPVADSDYMKNRLRFEAVFRNTINRLY